jgi:hypothetical protein
MRCSAMISLVMGLKFSPLLTQSAHRSELTVALGIDVQEFSALPERPGA